MARAGTAKARDLLYQIARKHNTDPRSVIEGGRWPEYITIKKEFCRAVKDNGIPLGVAADILKLDHSTVVYHASAAVQERKKQARTKRNAQVPQEASGD